jgi:hypothetical protein
LPLQIGKRLVISANAKRLAGQYYEMVKAMPKIISKNGRHRAAAYPHKNWQEHWAIVMQRWLDDGWKPEQVLKTVEHAFATINWIAKSGPQCLKKGRFERLAAEAGVEKGK